MPMFVKAALSVHLAMMQHVMCAKSPFATLAPIFTDVTTAVRDTVETVWGVMEQPFVSIVHKQNRFTYDVDIYLPRNMRHGCALFREKGA